MNITKEGDRYLRTMLVQGAHYILGPFAEDSDLRRWGLKLASDSSRGHRAMSVIQITRLDCCDHPHRSLGRPEQLPDSIN